MLDNTETIAWPLLARPYGQAERALGRLAHALETTPLHATWLWREITRVAVTIAQAGGYQTRVDQLRMTLIGAPVDHDDNTSGLAAAKRVFLSATPLFRTSHQADSKDTLWPTIWASHRLDGDSETLQPGDASLPIGASLLEGAGEGMGGQLIALVKEIAGFADDGRRPALINLFVDLRGHAVARRCRRLSCAWPCRLLWQRQAWSRSLRQVCSVAAVCLLV